MKGSFSINLIFTLILDDINIMKRKEIYSK